MVFAMVVIGGMASIPGALLGALYVRGVVWFLPADWQILATGAGMLVVLLVFRGGLGAAFADLRDAALRRIATRRAISVPSLVADAQAARAPGEHERSRPVDRAALLSVRELDVDYDGVQVLFGVDLDVKRGRGRRAPRHQRLREVDAPAGDLRPAPAVAWAGVVRRRRHHRAPPETIVARGVVQAPGGHGVLPVAVGGRQPQNGRLAHARHTCGDRAHR